MHVLSFGELNSFLDTCSLSCTQYIELCTRNKNRKTAGRVSYPGLVWFLKLARLNSVHIHTPITLWRWERKEAFQLFLHLAVHEE